MALNIQGISVATQPEVFQGMETGYGIAAGGEFRYRVHEVGLTELDVGMINGKGAHIQNFNFPERGYVGNESINSGANVHMSLGLIFEDSLCNQQILMKVVT
jgi:hypothetical protein